jgi:hypothetical protein
MNRLMIGRLMADSFPLNVQRSRRFKGTMHEREAVGVSHEPWV